MAEKTAPDQDELSKAAQYKALINTTQDGYWLLDSHGAIIEISDRACRVLEYNRDEILGKCIADIEGKETADDTKAHLDKVIEKGSDIFKTQLCTRTGKILDFEISTIFWKKGEIFFVIAKNITREVQDIRELVQTRKKLDELNTALRIVLESWEAKSNDKILNVQRALQRTVTPQLNHLRKDLDKNQRDIIDSVIFNINHVFYMPGNELIRKLNSREYKVGQYIVQGMTSKEIADIMGMSTRTIESCRLSIRKKLDMNSTSLNLRAELEAYFN